MSWQGTAPYIVGDIINSALRKLSSSVRPGRSASESEMYAGIMALNGIVDSANTSRLLIYSILINAWPLVMNQVQYTIGPGGDFDTTPFGTGRPPKLTAANIIYSSTSPPVRIPMEIYNDEQWMAIRLQQVPNTIPQIIYLDHAWPLGNIYIWGQAQGGLSLELGMWSQLTYFSSSDQVFSMPPGYLNWMIYSLAVELAGEMHLPLRPEIAELAMKYEARIKRLNAPSQPLVCDEAIAGSRRKGSFNYITGLPT